MLIVIVGRFLELVVSTELPTMVTMVLHSGGKRSKKILSLWSAWKMVVFFVGAWSTVAAIGQV